jgi:hypothetical protein
MTTIPIKAAARKPMPKNMIGSIMDHTSPTQLHALKIREFTATDPDGAGAYPKRGPASRYKKVQANDSKMVVNDAAVRTDSRSPAG